MLIILEGADFSGKSTIARLLYNITKFPVIKMKTTKYIFKDTNTLDWASRTFVETVAQIAKSNCNFILDRFCITGIVYSKVYNRRYSLYNIKELQKIKKHIKIIHLTYNYKRRSRNDKLITAEKIPTLIKEYKNIFRELKSKGFDVLTVNTSNYTKEATVQKILEFVGG